MAKRLETPIEDKNDSVIDLNIADIIPNVIDNYFVSIVDTHHTIFLPMNATGLHFRNWYRGKGGVYSKDVLNFTLNKPHGKYVIIKKDNMSFIARLIDDEEELSFKTMKLVDGYIKDRPYMILKNLQNGEKHTSTYRYINEKDMLLQLENEMHIVTPTSNSHDDDFDSHHGSISLFSE